MKSLILSMNDLQRIVGELGPDAIMDEMIRRLIDVLERFDQYHFENPTRDGFTYTRPHTGLVEWMPIMESGKRVTVKMVAYHPHNPKQFGLPTILSTVGTYDTHTGHLLALMDATFLTALRTGAASAVASRYLASPASKTLGLIGCGTQAVTQYHALSRLFAFERVLLFDVNPEATASFPRRAARLRPEGTEMLGADLESLVASSDILCTATAVGIGEGPVFPDGEHLPHLHINAVGADFPGKTELPISLLRRSLICHDLFDQVMKEGESQRLAKDEIGPSLTDLARDPDRFAVHQQELTVFDSCGWAAEDHIGMQMLMDYARELGVGSDFQVECVASDPMDPYLFLDETPSAG